MIPEHWAEINLENLCSICTGKRDVNEGNPNGRYPFFTCAQEPTKTDLAEFSGEAILVAGNGFFNVKHYVGDFNAYQRTYVLQNIKTDPMFLYFFIQFSLDKLTSDKRGTTVKYIRVGDLQNHVIPLPPLAEQKRIVAKLDAILPKIKAAKTRLENVSAILKKFRQSVLAAACSGRLTADWREGKELPEWEEKPLSEICSSICEGDHMPPPRSKSGIPFLVISNVNTGRLSFENTRFVPNEYFDEISETRKPKKGDVIYTIVGSIGISVLVDTDVDFCFQRHMALLKPNKVNNKFLHYTLQTLTLYEKAIEIATGIAQLTVPIKGLRNLTVPLPPFPEQEEIVRRAEKLFATADSVDAKCQNVMRHIEKLEQSILAKAFRGELAAANANDESADALLQRIIRERHSRFYMHDKQKEN